LRRILLNVVFDDRLRSFIGGGRCVNRLVLSNSSGGGSGFRVVLCKYIAETESGGDCITAFVARGDVCGETTDVVRLRLWPVMV
jgi:hypothetical protein